MLLVADVAAAAPAVPAVPAGPASAEHPSSEAAPSPHPGLTALDMQWFLERVATGDAEALAAVGPLTGSGEKVEVPPHLVAAVDDAPRFAITLAALADAHPRALGASTWRDALLHPLPPDLDRALSVVGQGVLGAGTLVADGESLAGARLVQHALDRARPTLEKHALLFTYRDAFSGLSFDEDRTRGLTTALAGARDAEAALAALGYARAVDAEPAALSEELAALYARLGVPVGFDTRAGLAAADGLASDVRLPLARALAHVRIAMDLRDAAFRDLGEWERAALGATGPVADAARSPAPSRADLTLLSAYGEAVARVDADALAEGMAHLVAASRLLEDATRNAARPHAAEAAPIVPLPVPPLPQGPDAGAPGDAPPRGRGFRIGDLVAEAGAGRGGDVVVRVGSTEEAPALTFDDAQVFPDAARGSLVVFQDADGNEKPAASEVVWASPPLRDAGNDVVFRDPYGFVLVTGAGESVTTAAVGGRRVDVVVDSGNATFPATPSEALQSVDARLRDAPAPASAAWRPFTRAYLRDLGAYADNGTDAWPERVTVTVNPAGYQVLHWDLGGDDAYHTNAGGAGTRGVLAVTGDGAAVPHDAFAGPLPVALLVDADGNDAYATVDNHTIAAANASLALLVDARGGDRVTFHGAEHGIAAGARAGVGVLIAGGLGARDFAAPAATGAVAFAEGAGTALLVSAGARDTYRAGNDSLAASRLGAVAALLDHQGDDEYTSGNFSQGASSGGVALLADASGTDRYEPRVRGTSQGYAEPYPAGSVPCLRDDACPQVLGPSRLALLVDARGEDAGACTAGALSNRLLGRVGVARAPTAGPYNPAAGACLDVDASPTAVTGVATVGDDPTQAGAAVPPTFFTSTFGNFTLPGLFRLGTLGDDLVLDPFLVSIDLGGDDTYAFGAMAVANATRAARLAWDLGYVAPVSIVMDADGTDTFDASLAPPGTPGVFGYADGGVAVQVHATAHRAAVDLDPSRIGELRDVDPTSLRHTDPDVHEPQDDEEGSPLTNATMGARTRYPVDVKTFTGVARGLANAENAGVALVYSDTVRHVVESAPSFEAGASCRLACARTGGVALWLATGGPGDVVNATPYSLGAVHDGPLGGVALYLHRGGKDAFTGDNRSMGILAPQPEDVAGTDAVEETQRPRVALFVKDGWSPDRYGRTMAFPGLGKLPRTNNATWSAMDTLHAFDAFGNRTLRVAQGYDNLDWFVENRVARADRGVGADTGPGDPFAPDGPLAAVRETLGLSPLQPVPGLVPGIHVLSGGSATGPDGVRPVTFARTAFSPILDVSFVRNGKFVGPNRNQELDLVEALSGDTTFVAHIRNPPAYRDASLNGSFDSGALAAREANAIQRVELVVRGAFDGWGDVCPEPALADDLDPASCVVGFWDRDRHGPLGSDSVKTGAATATPLPYEFWVYGALADGLDANNAIRTFPPGPYHLSVRAYAARPYGVPERPFGVHDAMLDATAADAWNVTDDGYGYYGSSWHYARPILNAPNVMDAGARIVDSNGSSPFVFEGWVTEPARVRFDVYHLERTFEEDGSLRDEREVRIHASPWSETPTYGDPDAFYARRVEWLNFTWQPPPDAPLGPYRVYPTVEGELSGITRIGKIFGRYGALPTLYVDPEAPPAGVDWRGLPFDGRITARDAPGGAIALPVVRDVDGVIREVGAPPAVYHHWVQEDVLDPAEPSRVLESFNWTYAGNATEYDVVGKAVRNASRPAAPLVVVPERFVMNATHPEGDLVEFTNVSFPWETQPGPPRRYRIVTYVEDRAGNVRVPDPETTAPDGPDCFEDAVLQMVRCADFLYDITPPRTTLALVDPAPEVARVTANRTVELLLDASETPDVADVQVLVARGPADAPPANLSVYAPLPRDAVDGAVVRWNASNVTHGEAVFFLARGIDRVGNVEEKVDYDTRVLVDLAAPNVTTEPAVEPRAFSATLRWETDEPAFGRVRVDGETFASNPTDDRPQTVHEATLTGLAPDSVYAATLVTEDVVGNVAEHGPFTVRTNRAVDVRIDPLPGVVAEPVNVTWQGLVVDEGLVNYTVSLSLDDGATFPLALTPRGLTVFETGNVTHHVRLDPRDVPESARARLRVRAVPVAAANGAADVVTPAFTLDAHAPVVNATAPRGVHDSWANATVNVSVTASDGASGVARVEWSRDDVAWHPVEGPLTFTASGSLFLRAEDAAGNVVDSVRVPVNVDRAPPRAWATSRAGSAVSAAAAVLDVDAQDAASGVVRVRLEGAHRVENLTADDFVDGVARVVWPLGPEEGSRVVRVTAWDAAGNRGTSTLHLTVDRTPPDATVHVLDRGLTLARLALTPDEPVRVTGHVARPDGVSVPLDGVSEEVLRPAFTLTARDLVPGAWHTVHLTLTDAAGNTRTQRAVLLTEPDVDPPAPVAALTHEAARDGAILLRWAPATDNTGIAQYEVWRDTARTRSTAPYAVTTTPFHLDTAAVPGVTYAYRVVPIDLGGNAGDARGASVTSRTAPRVTDVTAEALPGGLVEVRVNVTDPDGDRPEGVLRVGNASHAFAAARADLTGTRWHLTAVVAAPAERFGVARAFHVLVEDAAFTTRYPEAGAVPLPPHEGAGTVRAWLAGLAPVPAASTGAAVLLVLLAAGLVAWRGRGGGAS